MLRFETPAYWTNRRRPSDQWITEALRRREERRIAGRKLSELSVSELIYHLLPMAGGASSFTLTLDTTAPQTPTFTINSGASFATTQNVTCQIGTSDSSATGYQMKIWGNVDTANDADVQATEGASNWITFATTKAVKLSSGDGSKSLHCKIRDDVWNSTAQLDASITLDTTLPVVTISVGPDVSKVSKIATKDTCIFSFQVDSHAQAWKVKVVPSSGSLESAGTTIPTTNGSVSTTGGALNASTNQQVTIKGADLELAGAEGANVVKVFAQDDAGNWSV